MSLWSKLWGEKKNLFLLSAGKGERLKPFTEIRAKPAIPFLGVPLSAYPLSLCEGIEINKLIVNTHHLPETVERAHWKIKHPCSELIFEHEPELLGSGGGINNVRKHLLGDGSFLTVNADEVILPLHPGLIKEFMAVHEADRKTLATLLVMKHPDVGVHFGSVDCEEVSGASENKVRRVHGFTKKTNLRLNSSPSAPGADTNKGFQNFSTDPTSKRPGSLPLHFVGWMMFSERIFHFCSSQVKEENILHDVLNKALAAGEQVLSLEAEGLWFEMGNQQDLLRATESCLNLLKDSSQSYPAQFLQQTIAYYGTGETLVEASNPALVNRVTGLVDKGLATNQ